MWLARPGLRCDMMPSVNTNSSGRTRPSASEVTFREFLLKRKAVFQLAEVANAQRWKQAHNSEAAREKGAQARAAACTWAVARLSCAEVCRVHVRSWGGG